MTKLSWANNWNGVGHKYERPDTGGDGQYAKDCYKYQIKDQLPKEAPRGVGVRYE